MYIYKKRYFSQQFMMTEINTENIFDFFLKTNKKGNDAVKLLHPAYLSILQVFCIIKKHVPSFSPSKNNDSASVYGFKPKCYNKTSISNVLSGLSPSAWTQNAYITTVFMFPLCRLLYELIRLLVSGFHRLKVDTALASKIWLTPSQSWQYCFQCTYICMYRQI